MTKDEVTSEELQAEVTEVPEPEVEVSDTVKDAKDKPKKKRAKSVKKDFLFVEDDYKHMVEVEEEILQQFTHRGRIVNNMMKTGRFIEVKKFRQDFIRENRNEDIAKCRYRAAKDFGVSVKHLKEAYDILNGKKMDGFYITDLIDRFGFSKGALTAVNRGTLAEKYDRINSHCVDVAQAKLKGILSNANIRKAYSEYVQDFKEEFNRDTDDKAVYGE